ncbi:cutinase [Mycolicibacterium sp. GF69]|uniref:cutinase family protein n=1 Tax=Mycolicibacterium sp. GF69 TaxID=2267251 RepID=UPI000DCBF81B|nr:cutinase family protein [Mycolicibacterium sp. GF69]RAV05856.1 cutinase [Mycolicibacterium sp. GF69]
MATRRSLGVRVCATAATAGALLSAPIDIPAAAAQQCPDIEVVFARGTGDAPGVGPVGQAFIDSLRSRVGGRSVGVYAVNYAATMNFLRAAEGAADANGHVGYMAANCPATRLVLGGFSQGAAVVDLMLGVTPGLGAIPGVGAIPGLDAVPGLDLGAVAAPMPPQAADHVAAVAVFGNPLAKVLGPLNTLSPVYGARTIDLCNATDPICGEGDLDNRAAHHQYVPGMTDQAASFVAGLL